MLPLPLLLGMVANAQQGATTLLEPPIPLLPHQVTGLERAGDAVTGTDPGQADASNAPLLKEDGLERFSQAQYNHTTGGPALAATAMQFVDATGAYAAYTFYRAALPKGRVMTGAARLGTQSVADGDTVLVLAGTTILRMKGKANPREMLALTSALPKMGGRRALAPLLPTYLPAEGLEADTVRYVVGPIGYNSLGLRIPAEVIGFDKSAEVMTAGYGKGALTLLLYPTPQIAGEKGRAIEKQMNDPAGEHGALHNSMGMVKMRRVGPLLGITSGALSATQAQALVSALHLNQQVSFDQKMPLEFHAEVKKTATLLQNILFFSVVVGGGAVLLGLFLGGARAGIRVMMGKPAHSEPEFLAINLRDQPRPLFVPQSESKGTEGHS